MNDLRDAHAATGWLLALGSNLDAAEETLIAAEALLATDAAIVESSTLLSGADTGGGSRRYLNRLLLIDIDLPADRLVTHLKQVERRLGRSAQRQAAGFCDIDIDLLAGIESGRLRWLDTKSLEIPAVRQLVIERFGAPALPQGGSI